MASRAIPDATPPAMPVVTALPGYEGKRLTKKERAALATPAVEETEKDKGGRPTEYQDDYPEKVRALYANGATDVEVAEELEVSVMALHRWSARYPEFCEARKVAKDAADERVVRSLYQNAIYGDTTAQIFWLKNRRKKDWRDKQDISLHDDREPQQFDIRRLPVEMREQFRQMMLMMLPPEQRALMAPDVIEGDFVETQDD